MKESLNREYKNNSTWKNYMTLLNGNLWHFIWTWFIYLVKSLAQYVIPVLIAEVINMIANMSSSADNDEFFRKLMIIFLVGAVLVAQNIPTHIYFIHLLSIPCRNLEHDLRAALCVRMQQLSIPYHTASHLGELQNKITRDVEAIEGMTRMLMDGMPFLVFSAAMAVIVTLVKAPIFVLFYLVAAPIAAFIFLAMRKKMWKRNQEFHASVENMSGRVTEMLRLIPITRAHHLEDTEISRINERLDKIRTTGLKMDFINSVFGSVNWVIFMLFNLGTLVFVAILYRKGILEIGIGDIGLLSGYFGTITNCIMGFMNTLPGITKGMASVQSVCNVLECPDIELNDKPGIDNVVGEFEFDHVSFSYPNNDKHAVEDINLKVKPGETIAFVGSSGAGKSTLAGLLIGFIRPTSGRILLDGHNMDDIDLRTYRKHISVVTQETLLFDASVRDNICYGKDPTEEELAAAIQDAGLTDMLSNMPDGINTKIQENGSRLSGGQKQRIAIARALLRNPKVLILDEATSALDVETEAEIKKSFDRLIKGRTTFIVAHRLSTIRDADRIAVLQNGHIVEIGTHEELVKLGGIYADMNEKFANASK